MNPYTQLAPEMFWKTGAEQSSPLTIKNLYKKKFSINPKDHIVTAGSCFAQHINENLKQNGYSVLDGEPLPRWVKDEVAKRYGYRLYSARYGNIYGVRQLLQLSQEAFSGKVNEEGLVWEKEGRYYDALRPTVEPFGLRSYEEVVLHRANHLKKIVEVFTQANIFIFTLGLTETWIGYSSGRVYPTCPGTVIGTFDPMRYQFKNFSFNEVLNDFLEFYRLIKQINPSIKFILTVSPVPLTATVSGQHVISATSYSKAILRSVAGELYQNFSDIDYFPSYEIIANHWSKGFFYEDNLRTVSTKGIRTVMRVFFEEHPPQAKKEQIKIKKTRKKKTVCEEELLEAFAE